ncbi:MAG TPA: hypothetical protein VF550_08155, partial [Polyangia bacterium]
LDGTPLARCASQSISPPHHQAAGIVRGPNVDGETCDNGVGAALYGPAVSSMKYTAEISTTTSPSGAFYTPNSDGITVYGFLLRKPEDAMSGALHGAIILPSAETGRYDSTASCGWLRFDLTLAVPPNVVCTNLYSPCDPGCEPSGYNLSVCVPANQVHYLAEASPGCGPDAPPDQGTWALTATVYPIPNADPQQRLAMHGSLQGNLINQADPYDSVALSLVF